jgi:L-fuculose-phosphate aldolase
MRTVNDPSTPHVEAARVAVAEASRTLAAEGLVRGTGGNVSARVGELVAITPTGARLESLQAAQVTVVDLNGAVVAGDLAPSSEIGLHLDVLAHCGAGAVVHTHAPMATAVGTVIDELPCVHYEMLALGGPIRVAPYHTFGSRELADATVRALDGRLAALMANHGAITHAHDLAHALENTRLLEWACTVFWHAAAIGTPRTLSAEDLQAVVEAVVARGYGTTRSHAP